jgi:hypothetical protein
MTVNKCEMNQPINNLALGEEDFFFDIIFFSVMLVYWLDFLVLTCLLFYVLKFVYIATLAE